MHQHLSWIILSNPHSYLMRWILLSSPFYGYEKWGLEWLKHWPEITQIVLGFQARSFPLCHIVPSPCYAFSYSLVSFTTTLVQNKCSINSYWILFLVELWKFILEWHVFVFFFPDMRYRIQWNGLWRGKKAEQKENVLKIFYANVWISIILNIWRIF